jgi:hypothetical protein
MKTKTLITLVSLLIIRAGAQSVLFDFDILAAHSGLPASYTVGGITAGFSATGQGGFSIQAADTQGFTPVGFAGNCIYPNGVFAADLLISFSTALTDFSILYAPHELACDSSATMRVTAYMNGNFVGTSTTNAQAGTWPSETLRFSSPQGFNIVVVHYDAPPVTGGDYGPIFMADNMTVTPAPPPPMLWVSPTPSNYVHLNWATNYTGCTLQKNSDLRTTNWVNATDPITVVGTNYQADIPTTNSPRFFRLRSP